MSKSWDGKSVIVTGGSSGLGLAIARAFAERGAHSFLVARHAEPLSQAVQSLVDDGLSGSAIMADLTDSQRVTAAFDEIRQQSTTIDVLVNAAGRSSRGTILETTPDEFQTLWDLNFLGAVRCTRAAAKDLIKSRGHIVNVGSLASKTATRFLGAYPVSKFALAAYSQQLRLELGPQGLHVMLVCPGPLRRQDQGRRYDEQAQGLPASARRPGGGAKLKLIDPVWLARQIVVGCEKRSDELVIPRSARWLFALAQLWPAGGDWVLRRKT